jgi:ribosomal-protein-alanine N-acetyltransferase
MKNSNKPLNHDQMICTERLILRNWKESDFDPFADMCADQDVMKYFLSTLNRDESVALALKIKSLIDERGWGAWAVEIPNQCNFIGFVGLHIPQDNLPFSPCVEVLWRLAKPFWGNGYATEAAIAAINFGFSELELTEIVAFTTATNTPSIRVMEKIGMQNSHSDFAHPDISTDSPLSQHLLYRISSDSIY